VPSRAVAAAPTSGVLDLPDGLLQVLHHVHVGHPTDLGVVVGSVCGLLGIVMRQLAVLP
jgi:hypothetical protein